MRVLVRLCHAATAPRPRRRTDEPVECPREVRLVGQSAFQSDLGDGPLRRGEKTLGQSDSRHQHEIGKRHPFACLEGSRKITRAQVDYSGDGPDAQARVEVLADILPGPHELPVCQVTVLATGLPLVANEPASALDPAPSSWQVPVQKLQRLFKQSGRGGLPRPVVRLDRGKRVGHPPTSRILVAGRG